MTKQKSITSFVVDQHKVRTDGELISLNDIHALAGSPVNQEPYEWSRLPTTKQLIEQLVENLHTGKSRIYKVSKARTDRGGGTWAHKLLAVEYAGYLSSDLKLRINDTFLRVQEGDDSVIDEAISHQSLEKQKRTAARIQSKVIRNHHTAVLQEHGVVGRGYADCTNATYQPLLGGTADAVRKARNLPAKANIREAASLKELAAIMLAEAMADEKIEEHDLQGNKPCISACLIAATQVASIL